MKQSNLNRLKSELERRLIVLRYSKEATNSYKRIFSWVEDYLNKYGETNYTKELGQRFLQEYPLQVRHSQSQFKNARTLIRRLDETLENKMFTPCFRETKMECPCRFLGLHEKYLECLIKRGYSKSTIASRKMYSGRLLGRLPETILVLESLNASVIYDVFAKYKWPSVGLLAVRDILSFLFEKSITKTDLSLCVPRPRRPRSLPSVYSGNEVERLLSSVDRTTSLGKRDYAILLLAAHLGLRSSDIVGLSFKDIDFKAKTIEVIQSKTERLITLVMNSNVEEAIIDYISNGRPQPQLESSSDRIFLGSQAPFAPLTAGAGYVVARKYFYLAGIAAHGRRRGTHALRASYATALVAKGIPYAVVQEALGHEDPESAKYYVRIDVKRLRMCALDVPKPIGAFAVMLGDLEGVL